VFKLLTLNRTNAREIEQRNCLTIKKLEIMKTNKKYTFLSTKNNPSKPMLAILANSEDIELHENDQIIEDYSIESNLESEMDSKKWIKDIIDEEEELKVYESENFFIVETSYLSYELYAKEECSLEDIV